MEKGGTWHGNGMLLRTMVRLRDHGTEVGREEGGRGVVEHGFIDG